MINYGDLTTVMNLNPIVLATASAETAGVDIRAFNGPILVIVDCSAGTGGADNTIDMKLEESDDNVTFTDVVGGVFQRVSTATKFQKLSFLQSDLKRYVKLSAIIAGTSPGFMVSSKIIGLRR